jgi:hypothetical protein
MAPRFFARKLRSRARKYYAPACTYRISGDVPIPTKLVKSDRHNYFGVIPCENF